MLAGWEDAVPDSWRAVVGGTELNWKSRVLDQEMLPGEIILPKHPFRAFENTDPQRVRAVLLGQDPYTSPARATGRAFEQGSLQEWPENPYTVADSLRRLVLVLMSARTERPSYVSSDRAWTVMLGDARAGRLQLEEPRDFFDRLEREGVLFLNTSLTVSVAEPATTEKSRTAKQYQRHFQCWAPLINRVLSFLASRQNGHAVFLLFGRHAQAVFDHSRAKAVAEENGTWKTRVDAARHFHPAAITVAGAVFLRPPNPFCAANELLRRMGAEPIHW